MYLYDVDFTHCKIVSTRRATSSRANLKVRDVSQTKPDKILPEISRKMTSDTTPMPMLKLSEAAALTPLTCSRYGNLPGASLGVHSDIIHSTR